MNDFRYALRQIARTPAFTATAVLTLAVGIGVNTTLFTFANSIFLRPVPGVRADNRLAWITALNTRGGYATVMSYPDFLDYRDSSAVFEGAAAYGNVDVSVTAGDEPRRMRGQVVSSSFFSLLGVRMAAGRGFTPDEDSPSAPLVAIISHRLWQEKFDGDAAISDRTLKIDGQVFRIVGVAPERFNGADIDERRRDIWIPIGAEPRVMPDLPLDRRGSWWLSALGRLAPNVSVQRATAVAKTIAARIASTDSVNHEGITAFVAPMRGGVRPSDMRDIAPVTALATTATGLILLICCANVSNMLLGRAVGRRREIGVRLSLGATRRRLVRQLLVESALLSMIAGVLGLVLAIWSADLLTRTVLPTIDVSLDLNSLGFALGASLVTGILFGLAPALNATRADVSSALKDASHGFDTHRSRLQGAFVVAQISLSLVLLVTSGMFLNSLIQSARVDVGFEATSHVLAASFDLGLQNYTPERASTLITTLEQRARSLPGVTDVSLTNDVPLGERRIGADIMLDPRESSPNSSFGSGRADVYANTVRPAFFRTIGIGFVAGRDFTNDDVVGSPGVAVVSEDFARTAWPGTSPIGKQVSINGKTGPFLTVVGVVREALTFGVGERRRPIVYVSQLQFPRERDVTLLVRSRGDATTLAPAIRRELRALDRDIPIHAMQSLGQYRHDRLSDLSIGSTLLAIIGALAIALASVGLYAVVSFSIGQRTREIGVRVALGAAQEQVVALFLRQGARLAAVGLGVGLILGAGAAKVLSSVFLALPTGNVITFIVVAALLAGVALIASWIPARRAARVDPMVALRAE